MKKQFLPYYISRAILSSVFPILIFGFDWKALLFGCVIFAFFLLYLHSGWFMVDPDKALFPLRRDDRGQRVQRKALIMGVFLGLLSYLTLTQLSNFYDLTLMPGSISFSIAIVAYFASQFVLFAKT